MPTRPHPPIDAPVPSGDALAESYRRFAMQVADELMEGGVLVGKCPKCDSPVWRLNVSYTVLYNSETGRVQFDENGEEKVRDDEGFMCAGCGKDHPADAAEWAGINQMSDPEAYTPEQIAKVQLWEVLEFAFTEGPDETPGKKDQS